MGEIRENVKKNLAYFLSLKGISQKELANKLNVSQSAVTNWIKGKNSPDIEVVAQICQILGISISDIFGANTKTNYTDAYLMKHPEDFVYDSFEKDLMTKYNSLPLSERKIIDEVLDALLLKQSAKLNDK